MKKLLSVLLSVTVLFGAVACNQDSTNGGSDSGDNGVGDSGPSTSAENGQESDIGGRLEVLTFEYHEESVYYETLTTQKENFESEHAGVEIVYENIPYGEYENQLRLSLGSGSPADVIWVDAPYIASYAGAGSLEPLDDYWASEDFEKLVGSAQQAVVYDSKIYAAPLNEAAIAIFYNKEMFVEAGIEVPTSIDEQWTWDQLYEIAEQLTVKNDDGTTDIYGLSPSMGTPSDTGEGVSYSNMAWMWQAGGQPLSDDGTQAIGYFDSPEIIDALTFYQRLHVEGISPLQGIVNAFPTGKVAMIISGPWEVGHLELNFPDFEFGTMPLAKNRVSATPTGSWNVSIPANSDNKDTAWAFVETLVNEEGSKLRTDASGDVPAVASVLEASDRFSQEIFIPFKEQVLTDGRARPVSPVYPEISELLVRVFSDVAFGEDPTEVAANYAQQMQEVLDRQ